MDRGSAVRFATLGCVAAVVLACGEPPPADDAGADAGIVACTADVECDDGVYCNGGESCAPGTEGADARGCVAMPSPCMPSQRCVEAESRCVSSCAVSPDADGDGVDATECGGADCDDADPLRYPGATEVCDATDHDEDCNPATFGERDADGDTFFDAACCNAMGDTEVCGDDCNDRRRDVHPGSSESCDELDNDCDGATDEGLLRMSWPDLDRDLHGDETAEPSMACPGTPGLALVADDCDDTSPIRHRAQLEICDRIDNDCDGLTDESPVAVPWYRDEDGDLFGAPSDTFVISCEPVEGYSTRSSDCNDGDRMINPLATERCNGVDDDCNGRADAPGTGPGDTEDDDGDQIADRVCGGSDCDDANPFVHPMAQEICNGIDDDCDGVTDGADADARWYLDRDLDGYGDESEPYIEACEPQPLRVTRGGDCDDGDASVHPRAPDFCDDVDADCDGSIDENGVRFAFFPDADGDGWGTTDRASVVFRCTRPAGTSERTGDCSDVDPTRHPTAPELCNSVDDDCDGTLDESTTEMWYADADGDGRGAGAAIRTCLPSAMLSAFGDDCDDGDASRFPTNTESCNSVDDDCDTTVDEGASSACAYPNATGVCTAGACVLTCAAGYGDCDGALTSGCEADTDRSAVYCGSCTTSCSPGDLCGTTAAGRCDVAPVIALAASAHTVMALRDGGGVAAWGGAYSWLSTFTADRADPAATSMTRGIADIDLGIEFGCARTASRRMLCWGSNTQGQLGDGGSAGHPGPTEVPGLTDVVDIATGHQHACAVLLDGTMKCWGQGNSGALGLGSLAIVRVPTTVPGITDAVEVWAGNTHTCARRGAPGAQYVTCWGYNSSGALGLGTTGATYQTSPGAPVMGLPSNLAGFAHGQAAGTCVRTTDGTAYCWGANSGGALGLGTTGAITTATLLSGMTGVVEIALAVDGGCLRRGAAGGHEVWCWGFNTTGWIDGAATGNVTSPRRAAGGITDAVAIAVGEQRWCAARSSTGGVVCMGTDTYGGLGNQLPLATSTTPVTVYDLP